MQRLLATLATPPGEGGIHVILLAGAAAPGLLAEVFSPVHDGARDRALALGRILDGDEILDEVLLARRESPAGAAFEINAHGGPVSANAVLALLGRRGARILSWPRFARRAGLVAGGPASWRAAVLLARAPTTLAAALLAGPAGPALPPALHALATALSDPPRALEQARALAATVPLGRTLASPPEVLLTGPPNAGKSTLFNALVGRVRVLVDPESGTTRDRVAEGTAFHGVPVTLADSPGLGPDAGTPVTAAAQAGARRAIAGAALRVFLFDGAREVSCDDLAEWRALKEPRLAAAGKADLPGAADRIRALAETVGAAVLPVSGARGIGLDALRDGVLAGLGIGARNPDPAAPIVPGGRLAALILEIGEALERGDLSGRDRWAHALRRAAGGG